MLALEEPPRLAMMQSEQDWCDDDGPRSWTDPNVQHMDSARGILILSERGGLNRQSILLAGSFYEGDGPPEIGFTRFRARANAHAPLIG